MNQKTKILIAAMLLVVGPTRTTAATEEHLRGILEHTVKPGACAQITDALRETYYVVNTPEAQKSCADLFGRKTVVTGIVEQHPGDQDYYIRLVKAEAWEASATGGTLPRTPPAPDATPSAPLAPPANPTTPPAIPAPSAEQKIDAK